MFDLLVDLEECDKEIESLTDYEYIRGYEFGDVADDELDEDEDDE